MAMQSERALTAPAGTSRGPGFHWDRIGPSAVHAHVTRPIVQRLDACGARRVLDLGCGNGWFTAALQRCGFDAMGADASETGIELAQRTHPEVPFRRLDAAERLDSDLIGQFDAVVAVELLDHVCLPRDVLRQAVTALRPGGLLLASVPYHGYLKNLGLALLGRFDERWHALRDHGRVKFFSRRTLAALLAETDLQQLRIETVGRVPLVARSLLASAQAPGDELAAH